MATPTRTNPTRLGRSLRSNSKQTTTTNVITNKKTNGNNLPFVFLAGRYI